MKLYTVDNVSIPILDGNIGICASGGADSAVLLYILMTQLEPSQELHIFTFGKLLTHYSTLASARTVAKRCSDLTGFINYTHHVDYADNQTVELLHNMTRAAGNNGIIQALYTGQTANPPKEIADGFLGSEYNSEHKERDPDIIRDIMYSDKVCNPFTNLNKQHIASIYHTLGLTDTLYPYTRSCENYDPVYLGTHCGECWWCKERSWGFGKL